MNTITLPLYRLGKLTGGVYRFPKAVTEIEFTFVGEIPDELHKSNANAVGVVGKLPFPDCDLGFGQYAHREEPWRNYAMSTGGDNHNDVAAFNAARRNEQFIADNFVSAKVVTQ